MLVLVMITVKQRFWRKVTLPNEEGCMLWTGAKSRSYGDFRYQGRNQRAHRVSLIFAEGEPSDKYMEAAHSCRAKDCVAPEHLSWKTKAGNEADKKRDGTDNGGERNGMAKLTDKDVKEILRLYATGNYSYRELSRQFGVHFTHIGLILKGKRWG